MRFWGDVSEGGRSPPPSFRFTLGGQDPAGGPGRCEPAAMIAALTCDTYGTVVDWRGSILAELESWGRARRLSLDWVRTSWGTAPWSIT